MWPVEVPIISNNGLTKEVYGFKVEGTSLSYIAYFKYERESILHIWPDEWPNAISLTKWVNENCPDWETEYDGDEPDAYTKYHNSLNPCMNKTSDGRCMGSGQSGFGLKRDHPLPPQVPALAREELFKILTVDGE